MAGTIKNSIQTRKIAILACDGVDAASLKAMKTALEAAGSVTHVIAPKLGPITAEDDTTIDANHSFLTAASVLYDAVYIAGGDMNAANLVGEPDAVHFINEAYKHCKAIACERSAMAVLEETYFNKKLQEKKIEDGVIIGDGKKLAAAFIKAVAQHRFWEREKPRKIPA
jgi:catalase